MRALERRLARLESVSLALEDALVSPEALRKIAAVVLAGPIDAKLRAMAEEVLVEPFEDVEAARRRVREKLMSDGPHVPAGDRPVANSEAAQIVRQKLLRPDVLSTAETVA